MKPLSFRVQGHMALAVLACAFLFGHFFKAGVFCNIGWILAGLLFVLNPIWPEGWDWKEHDKLEKGIRIGSILVIVLFGFFMRYGV